ncbi:MAG: hypothetical protein JWL71_4587 [Acidobacteria bacterium]|nr:hypothetical protein [Acidobacteriota bacterium]
MTRRTWLYFALAYAAVTALLTYPLVWHLTDVVPHDLADPLLSVSILRWNAHVLPLTPRWWDGFSFYPASGTLALSDHRLGESLLAAPLQWAGASEITAYNLTLLATFPLCALSAHWLAFTLTRRHDAAFLGGLIYGFSPFRIAHLEHLELLAAFGIPAALAALHRYARTRRRRWLVVYAVALAIQALSASYYAMFFSIVLALWLVWFLRWNDRRVAIAIVAASACAVLALAPILVGYLRWHARYGLGRTFREIQTYSADVSSFATASPLMALWGWTWSLNGPERQLFPGLTALMLVAVGAGVAWRGGTDTGDRFGRARLWLAGVSIAFVLVAISVLVVGPWSMALGPIRASVRDGFKPLTGAIMALAVAVACLPSVRGAFHRRSVFAFYLVATFVLCVLSLGPTPAFLGAQFMYRPPYAWLMNLPMFADGVRAPARLAMPAIMTLSAAAALAFARLVPAGRRAWIAPIVAIAVMADSWTHSLPLRPVPRDRPPLPAADQSAVLTVPFGDLEQEAIAVYRTLRAGFHSVNGMSGFDPLHYVILRRTLEEGDATAIEALQEHGPLLIVVDKPADTKRGWIAFVERLAGGTRIGETERWAVFRFPGRPPLPPFLHTRPLAIAAIRDERGEVSTASLTDGDPTTGPHRTEAQFAGEMLTVDLGRPASVEALEMSFGRNGETYPRLFTVATSRDGERWETIYDGPTGGRAFRGALADPRDVRIEIGLGARIARFVRLRVERAVPNMPWWPTEVAVKGVSAPTPE